MVENAEMDECSALNKTFAIHFMAQGTLQKKERVEEPEDKAKCCGISSSGPDTAITILTQQQPQVTTLGLP